MDSLVQRAVGGLEPQQVAVGPRLAPGGQFLVVAFAQAERDGQRGFGLDPPHQLGDPLAGQFRVFARLEHDRAVAELDGLSHAGHDLVVRHAIALQAEIARPQAAVAAQPHAMVRQLDQPAQMDLAADVLLPHLVGQPPEVGKPGGVGFPEPVEDFAALHEPIVRSIGNTSLYARPAVAVGSVIGCARCTPTAAHGVPPPERWSARRPPTKRVASVRLIVVC